MESLIKAGSDLNLQENQHQNSPLHEALVQHHTEAALMLLEAGESLMALSLIPQHFHVPLFYNLTCFNTLIPPFVISFFFIYG